MANEKRLIDANALIDAFRAYMADRYDKEKCVSAENCKLCTPGCLWRKIIVVAPTVDAVEVVHGYWEKEHDDLGIDRGWKCSHCKGSVYEMTYEPYQYCPHCGAKMDGDHQ